MSTFINASLKKVTIIDMKSGHLEYE